MTKFILKSFTVVIYFFISLIFILLCKFYFSSFAYVKSSGVPGLLSKDNIDYLFIGSSLTKQSYNIRLIENEFHVRAYAVSYNGLSPLMAKTILEYALDNTDIEIKKIVFETYPYKLFSKSSSIEDKRLFNSSTAKLKLEILKIINKEKLDLKTAYKLIITNDNESILSAPIVYKILEKFDYNGGYVLKYVAGQKSFKMNTEFDIDAIIDEGQSSAYKDLIRICSEHNIELFFVEPFVPYYVQNGYKYQTAKKEILNLLKLSNRKLYESNLTSLDNKDPSLFGDMIHLSTKGRDLWSKEIMRIIDAGQFISSESL